MGGTASIAVRLLSALSRPQYTPRPNLHQRCSRRPSLATPLSGVRALHTNPPAARSSALEPVRPLGCRYRKTSASRISSALGRCTDSTPLSHWKPPACILRVEGEPSLRCRAVANTNTPPRAMASPATARRTEPLHDSKCSYWTTGIAWRHAVPDRKTGIFR